MFWNCTFNLLHHIKIFSCPIFKMVRSFSCKKSWKG